MYVHSLKRLNKSKMSKNSLPQKTDKPYLNWTQDPRNPMRKKAAE